MDSIDSNSFLDLCLLLFSTVFSRSLCFNSNSISGLPGAKQSIQPLWPSCYLLLSFLSFSPGLISYFLLSDHSLDFLLIKFSIFPPSKKIGLIHICTYTLPFSLFSATGVFNRRQQYFCFGRRWLKRRGYKTFPPASCWRDAVLFLFPRMKI